MDAMVLVAMWVLVGMVVVWSLLMDHVPDDECWVVKSFGDTQRVLMPGMRFRVPFLEPIRATFDLKEQALTVELEDALTTLDKEEVVVRGEVRWLVVDPAKAASALPRDQEWLTEIDQRDAITDLAKSTFADVASTRTSQEARNHPEAFESALTPRLNDFAATLGIEITGVRIREVARFGAPNEAYPPSSPVTKSASGFQWYHLVVAAVVVVMALLLSTIL